MLKACLNPRAGKPGGDGKSLPGWTMKYLALILLVLSLAACAPAPVRPPPPAKAELEARAILVQEREARLRAERERAQAERALAEFKRREAEERAPRPGRINLPPTIAARPLEPEPRPEPLAAETKAPSPSTQPVPAAAPAETPQIAAIQPKPVQRIDPAAFAWQLSDDLRRLHSEADVQTLYIERGWVVSLGAEALFEPGEASLRTDVGKTLDRLARVLRHYAARGIVMEGPDAARAQAVKRALTARGIPEDGIAANGTGERIEFLIPHAQAFSAGAGR
jgi:outer membrane protein OmpA-like peptidoglycan-associated protein